MQKFSRRMSYSRSEGMNRLALEFDALERRRRWFDGQLDLDPLKLVFVDETAATTNMARRYVGDDAGDVCAAAFRTAITKRSPSSSACA